MTPSDMPDTPGTPGSDAAATITVDQFVARPPADVWRALTEPDLVAKWWVTGDIAPVVGHEFTLDMGPWGPAACRVVEVVPPERFVYTFTEWWTLTWTLVAEGSGTRVLLEHSGFDLDDDQHRHAFEMMGPGWRDDVLPRLAEAAEAL
jgi:uncharacterized protein YndB with AHSA1/START domain